jgi:hypothetical protein
MPRFIRAIMQRLSPFNGMAEYYYSLSPAQRERWWEMVRQTRPSPWR